jgi:hypothetical protein
MKVGIYGDSYADPVKNNNTPSWIDILMQRYSRSFSHGYASTNLFYSFREFNKYHKNYDKNIVLVTDPFRIWADRFDVSPPSFQFMSGISNTEDKIEWMKKHCKNEDQQRRNIKILESALVYYAYIQNSNEELLKQQLIIDKILSLNPDTLVIPCFSVSIPGVNIGLENIFRKENEAWGIDFTKDKFKDARNCHMTAENNVILANKIIEHLEGRTQFDLNIDDFVTPANKEFYIKYE